MIRTTAAKSSIRFTPRLFVGIPTRRYQSTTVSNSSGYASVPKLKNVSEFQGAIKSNDLSIIDFFATWCGPCKSMIPFVSKSIQENPDVKFYKVDVDQSPDVAKFCEITAMPTFVFARDGKILHKTVGANPHGLQKSITDLK